METARGQAAGGTPEDTVGGPPRARRRLSRATVIIAALIAVVALGVMGLALSGVWPPPNSADEAAAAPTAKAIADLGLRVEKAGDARIENKQVYVPVRVTNQVMKTPPAKGTPAPGAAAPGPEQAKVIYARIKVTFYSASNTVVGSAWGEVLNLDYGQSTTITVVGTDIPGFNRYEITADQLFTDKESLRLSPMSAAPQFSTLNTAN